MPFSSLRLGQFCDFRSKVCFLASGSKRFEIFFEDKRFVGSEDEGKTGVG
ncbi:hypothetical protein HanIR_Chr01g0039891 [Helianthus annuus]|nr:hypothetical protein HanIR_Chr01g0039891 [Helianthus annuus]